VGSVADAYDNALAETTIGLYKAECTRDGSPFRDGPLRTLGDVEKITSEWVHWYNTERIMQALEPTIRTCRLASVERPSSSGRCHQDARAGRRRGRRRRNLSPVREVPYSSDFAQSVCPFLDHGPVGSTYVPTVFAKHFCSK